MMIEFVGRDRELADLQVLLDQVNAATGGQAPGRCVQMRGRRRIGKSSLVEEFLRRSGAPAVFFTASRRPAGDEAASLWTAVTESSLPGGERAGDVRPVDWHSALRALADLLPADQPSVVVLDEVPYLIDTVPAFEGTLQAVWDRQLSRKPVLLILIGSDLAMMEALNQYDRPFHQRGSEMVVGPLNPADVADMLRLEPAAAIDAALVTGGLPLVCLEWEPGTSVWEFLEAALANPVSALTVSAERALSAEFPSQAQARQVLSAIGSGERTFTGLARAAGGIGHSSLERALEILTRKRIVVSALPLSTSRSRERRYRLADPYLSFWLSFIEPNQPLIERRRPDLVLDRIRSGWSSWRGRAVEPLVREALARLLPAGELPAAPEVGAYWARSHDVEIDIVGADRAPVANRLLLLGSIKWREAAPFDDHDLAALQRQRAQLTPQPVPLLAVSRSGVRCGGLAGEFTPADLVDGWRPSGRA